ncbi:hypothetical protein LH487_27170, partial [Klebsiella pneumoniae]|uniref:hypothetical protein n=1 Tax=Klebsiella pneumoniae TaxID=573 RepID=UPI001E5F4E65
EKTKGFVKFYRVLKKAITGHEVTPKLLESIALPLDQVDLSDENETVVAVVNPEAHEIAQEDLEATADLYDRMQDHSQQPKLVEQNKETAAELGIIVGAEALATQINHFNDADDEGFKAFMTRLAKVAKVRGHSAQELMDFLKKNDLPIAKD